MGTLSQDVRYALRMFARNKGVVTIAVIALALGIGANTAIFSLVNAVLLKPLPFARPNELVQISGTGPQLDKIPSSPANFLEWKEQNRVFARMAAYNGQIFTLLGGDAPQRIHGLRASADFFDLLGVHPALGRSFVAQEDEFGRNTVVVLSHEFWQTRFGANRGVIGQQLLLNDKNYTVIGVMPAGFTFPDPRIQVWTPMGFSPAERAIRDTNFLSVIGRLRDGVTLKQARAEMNLLARQQGQQHPELNAGSEVKLVTLLEETVGEIRPVLFVMSGAVVCVLIICCANIANLLLALGAHRRKEIAVRSALGASRGRIVRLLLTESVLLALLGGVLGCALAYYGINLLVALKPENLPRLNEVAIDFRVLAFTASLSLLTGILFGLAPAWQLATPRLSGALQDSQRGGTAGPATHRLRSLLVIAEVALSLMLLIAAGLLIQTFIRIASVKPGFRPENVLTVALALPESRYSDVSKRAVFFQRLLERVREIPGVQAAGVVSDLPLFGGSSTGFDVEGRPLAAPSERPMSEYRLASPDYFRAMGIELLAGRFFNEQDRADKPQVAIINETLARKFFGQQNPIGKRIGLSRPMDWREVVGVVRDVKNYGLTEAVKPECYVPYLQSAPDYLAGVSSWVAMMVRTESSPLGYATAIKREVQMLDKDQPISSVKTLNEYLAQSVAQRRFNMELLAIFAAVALVLAAIGIYGVIAYTATERTKEIGIRMALGAQAGDVLKLIVRQGLFLTLVGVGIGVAGAFALTRVISNLLFGVRPTDPPTFIGLSLFLILISLLACYLPARRASKMNPVKALASG